jgi:hypothetical protein
MKYVFEQLSSDKVIKFPAWSNSDSNLGGKTIKFNPRDRVQKFVCDFLG